MRCNICGNEIDTDYRTLNLNYEVKERPPKHNPFRQTMKTKGFAPLMGTMDWPGNVEDMGVETFIDKATICSTCEPEIDKIIDALKTIFQKGD